MQGIRGLGSEDAGEWWQRLQLQMVLWMQQVNVDSQCGELGNMLLRREQPRSATGGG